VSNEEVLQRANTSRNLLKVIVNRRDTSREKSQLEAIALTGTIESKRARGRRRKTYMDWLSFASGEQWKINDILKICQERNEHKLYRSESNMALTQIGLEARTRRRIVWKLALTNTP